MKGNLALALKAVMMNLRGMQSSVITGRGNGMKKIFNVILIFGLATLALRAQDEVPPPMPAYQALQPTQMDELLGPIALYPDPLISIILPASTFPTQIVMADRYLSNGGDPNAIDQQPWDSSVQALAHYPQVLSWMDNNLNWTTQVGEAFINQQQDVMDSIQRLRVEAYNLGNLQSTPQQQVVDDNGYIEILPATPDNVYVPEYQPDQVYYQPSYGGAPFITFSTGYIIGPWLCYDFDWHNRHLVHWDRNNPRPNDWWHNRPDWRTPDVAKHTTVWNPAAIHPSGSVGFQGDRGWSAPVNRGTVPENRGFNNPENHVNNPENHGWTAPSGSPPPTVPAQRSMPVVRSAPPVIEHATPPPQFQPNFQRPADNAFQGIDNAQETRAASERGAQSTRSVGEPPPAAGGFHGGAPAGGPAPGGGFHGGGGGGAPAGGGGGRGR